MKLRTLGLLTALAIAATAYLATPNPAAAAPFTYTLSGVTATFPGGTDQITGSFTYDPSTGNQTGGSFVVTGPVFPGTYIATAKPPFPGEKPFPIATVGFYAVGYATNVPTALVLKFTNPLSPPAPAAVQIIQINPVVDSSSATGEVIVATAPCTNDCYNTFTAPLSQSATSFTIKLPGNVVSEINTTATENDPLVNPLAIHQFSAMIG